MDTASAKALDPNQLAASSDVQLEALFQQAGNLGLEQIQNTGAHKVDLNRREIFNDTSWKGYLPVGLPLGEAASRLSTGYAKRFWKQKDRYLGETQYLDGRLKLKHSLEEITIDQPVNDLVPGRYILLRYTDPVFEDLFYDIMKAASEDVILYRGYTGRFPNGKRGWTAPLLRRYGFPQMGAEDHRLIFRKATTPSKEQLAGTWRMDVIANSNHTVDVARIQFLLGANGKLESRYEEKNTALLPDFATDRFRKGDIRRELRRVGEEYLLGRWATEVRGPFAKLFRGGSLGIFHAEKDETGAKQFGLYYLLTRVS